MEKKFTFQGHTFDDEKQLISAKKEAEAVEKEQQEVGK